MADVGDAWPCMGCGVPTALVLVPIMVGGKPVQHLVCGCPTCHPERGA